MHYGKLPKYLEQLNVDTVYILERPQQQSTAGALAVVKEVKWREHGFWTGQSDDRALL